MGGQGGLQGQFSLGINPGNRYQLPVGGVNPLAPNPAESNRLTFEQLQERKKEQQQAREEAKKVGSAVAGLDPTDSISPEALGESVGDHFQYTIDEKVSLPRQRSALLPLVNQEITGTRVSVYNEKVHARFPLRGLRFKNTTGQTLMQGPIAVYEGGTYAGDARLPDLQANEERLVSYAIDQGVEVKVESPAAVEELTAVKIDKGIAFLAHRLRTRKVYHVKNRSTQGRSLLVEHPARDGWTLAGPEKAVERTRDFYRFAWKADPGQALTREVIEERGRTAQHVLLSTPEDLIHPLLRHGAASPAVKEALRKSLDFRARLAGTRQELAQLEKQLKAITDDQARLRANLDKLPATSAAHKRYLEKFDTQETQVEKLQAGIAEKQETEKAQQKEFEDYLKGLTVE
jgi:hypothetical protein